MRMADQATVLINTSACWNHWRVGMHAPDWVWLSCELFKWLESCDKGSGHVYWDCWI